MKSFSKDAQRALENAERQVREAAANALLAGDYERATELIGTAQQLSKLAMGTEAGNDAIARDEAPISRTSSLVGEETVPNAVATRKQAGYPRFARDGSHLVKTGWSKTAKAEYEHRCPESVCRSLMSAMKSIASRQGVFAVEDIMPNHSYVPAYQVYLVVAWLRAEGLLAQHGRRGYTIVAPNDFETRADRAWQRLPTHTPRS